MNSLGIKSLSASNVLLDIVTNYGETYKEVREHTGLNKRNLLKALEELTELGLVEKYKEVGSREYQLRATLPTPIAHATILERCIEADEKNDFYAKMQAITAEVAHVFPKGSYEGKEPGFRQVHKWLAQMGDSAVKLYGLLEDLRNVELTEGGPINYVSAVIADEAETTDAEYAAYRNRQKKITDYHVAKELHELSKQTA